MKNNSTKGKMSIIWFIPSMVKKTGHIYQKKSRAGAKVTKIFMLS